MSHHPISMRLSRFTAVLVLALCSLSAHGAATDPALDRVLRQLDAASLKFTSAEADLKVDLYEKVVRDTTTQTGTVYFLRAKSGTEMGAVFVTPSKKFLKFKDGNGELYDVVAKKATPFSAGKDRARAESFLTLGFGGSGKDLERAWDIKLLGTEAVNGEAATKMDLTPRDPSVAQMFTHVVVWVDPARGISLKQQSVTAEGDTRTTYYSNIRYNVPVDTKKYAAPKH